MGLSFFLQGERSRSLTASGPATQCDAVRDGFEIVRGREDVLRWLPELQELAARCGQSGAVDHLPFHLSEPYFGNKQPTLLTRQVGGRLAEAVLLHEYRVCGLRTGCFIAADTTGEWTVLAAAGRHSEVAWNAALLLLRQGARLVLVSAVGADFAYDASHRAGERNAGSCATQTRVLRRTLPLAATVDETLAALGRRSRRNFRAYRRRSDKMFALRYQDNLAVNDADFLELNAGSAYAVPEWVAAWRLKVLREAPGAFAVGLRVQGGEWLSMVGGRRRGDTTIVDWQMNRGNFATLSLGTVMRSYLLQSELERGMRFLRFEGGTSHAMRSAFREERVGDLLLTGPWLRSGAAQNIFRKLLPKGNLLATTVDWNGLQWHP